MIGSVMKGMMPLPPGVIRWTKKIPDQMGDTYWLNS